MLAHQQDAELSRAGGILCSTAAATATVTPSSTSINDRLGGGRPHDLHFALV